MAKKQADAAAEQVTPPPPQTITPSLVPRVIVPISI
jgi:hypothetical protein